jgi:MGT family glycosyltransferase
MQRLSSAPPRVLRTYALSDAVRAVLGDRLTARVTPALVRAVIRRKMGPLGAAARARGQRGQRLIWDLLEGDLNLLTDTEGWSPTRHLPASFHRVGPIVWEPDLPVPDSLADLDPERPTLYVTFGSTGHPDLFRRIFAEFAGSGYQVILSTGGQIDPRDFDVPRNFVVERFLPNAEIMERADLVIYHGGAGTAYQALRAGVPGIVIATHWDQEFAGFATEDHGLGLYLPMRRVVRSPGLLLRATRGVLQDLSAHRLRAEALQRELRKYDGPVSAADRLEAFLEEWRG